MIHHRQRSWLERAGTAVSSWVADRVGHPYAQVGVITLCALWWLVGLPTDILTAALSILAITFTQMVLNNQAERETDAHRRDVAMHAKLDELLAAMKGARNEFVGIEELDEADIEELKEEVRDAIDEAGPAAGDRQEREIAKRAAAEAVEEEVEEAKARKAAEESSRPRRKRAGER